MYGFENLENAFHFYGHKQSSKYRAPKQGTTGDLHPRDVGVGAEIVVKFRLTTELLHMRNKRGLQLSHIYLAKRCSSSRLRTGSLNQEIGAEPRNLPILRKRNIIQ